jgi:hypothetical protein
VLSFVLWSVQAYDAIQYARHHKSFHAWNVDDRDPSTAYRRRLGSKNDFVAVFHSSGGQWNNVITPSVLVDICQSEKMLLASQGCLGPDVFSLLDKIFDANCDYKTSFEESLPLFSLPENSIHVEDNVHSGFPKSAVLLSYYSTSCKLKLAFVDKSVSQVESSIRTTGISYAQNRLIIDAFIQSGIHDVKLSVIAMLVCVFILSLSLGLKRVLFTLLFTLCIVFSLIISASVMPLLGFSLFSAFNVLAVFVITGVGADSIIVFVKSWQSAFEKAKEIALERRRRSTDNDIAVLLAEQKSIDITYMFPSILHHSYGSVTKALTFSMMTTVLSFMANMVSPIVVIAQLGSFMGMAMIAYFVLLHLILIPAWISMIKVRNGVVFYKNNTLNMLGSSCWIQFVQIACRCSVFWTDVVLDVLKRKPTPSHQVNHDAIVFPAVVANKKQGRLKSYAVLMSVLISMPVAMYGISSITVTDFGLPLLFKEGVNLSDLIYIAKHFKSDLLTLSSEDNSRTSEEPSNPKTSVPTIIPTASHTPTHTPSFSPSTHRHITQAPTDSPAPTHWAGSTYAPTILYSDLHNRGKTYYTVHVCYGIDIEKEFIDSDATAIVNAETFAPYAEQGLLSDTATLCNYVAANKNVMEVTMSDSDCIYNQLMALTPKNISIYERIGLWLIENAEDSNRFFQVGVETAKQGPGSGNFGLHDELLLTWLCQPVPCVANVSSFFDEPDHALQMIDRWERALYGVGNVYADTSNVVSLTGSEAWLFPVLSDQMVRSVFMSLALSILGSLSLLFIATWNMKLSLLIGCGMIFVILVSLLLHALIFSSVIDLIDIVVLISFVGIIVDYPTHMAFHREHDVSIRRRKTRSDTIVDDESNLVFHQTSFEYMRATLLGPALTTVFSAVPLLMADFTLLVKAGQYMIILCMLTYLYVALVMPILLRWLEESVFCLF